MLYCNNLYRRGNVWVFYDKTWETPATLFIWHCLYCIWLKLQGHKIWNSLQFHKQWPSFSLLIENILLFSVLCASKLDILESFENPRGPRVPQPARNSSTNTVCYWLIYLKKDHISQQSIIIYLHLFFDIEAMIQLWFNNKYLRGFVQFVQSKISNTVCKKNGTKLQKCNSSITENDDSWYFSRNLHTGMWRRHVCEQRKRKTKCLNMVALIC